MTVYDKWTPVTLLITFENSDMVTINSFLDWTSGRDDMVVSTMGNMETDHPTKWLSGVVFARDNEVAVFTKLTWGGVAKTVEVVG